MANPFDLAWGTSVNIDAQNIAANLFASSIIPYAAFLYFLTKSKKSPGKALFGFYFLLVFVFATIPAGIYAKLKYGTILANVDWLHGSAESFLTITNLFIVFGVREGIRDAEREKLAGDAAAQGAPVEVPDVEKVQK
ncbi:g12249 [Coccomyxa viridis]|uniref:G12249 protein n=1 Tax=Coccomyxa viridis TaxID=1274662 RepID=A0ABP1GCJ6_9CHLO